MRIVYLDADFAFATHDSGPRSYAFARRLIARGHEVMLLTSDRRVETPADAQRVWPTEIEGVGVTVVNVGLGRCRGSPVGREACRSTSGLRHHLLFAWAAAAYLLRCQRPDVVYVTSPPLSAIVPALAARWLRGVPFVLEVREIWPEVAQSMDLIRSRVLGFVLRRLALLGYRRAAAVVALTEAAVNHIQADIPLMPKVVRIGVCCDIELFAGGDGTEIRRRQGWTDKFVCLHAGPMVRSAGLEAILRVADVLREDEQFIFWLVGDGDQRAALEGNVRDRELHNVFFWDAVPRAQLPDVLAAADLCLLTVRHCRALEQSSGDRLFDYLAAGKPVLLNYSGWQRDLLEEHGAGRGTLLSHHGEFFEHICQLCDRPDLRAQMAANARQLAQTACHPDRWVPRLEQVLISAVSQSHRPAA